MRQTNGWVKLHTSLMDHRSVSKDPVALSILIWLISKANWKASKVKFEGRVYELLPGQIVTSVLEMEEATGVPRTTVERKLKWFIDCETIAQKTGSHGRIITLTNWTSYQAKPEEDGQQPGNNRVTTGQQVGTYEEEKNLEEKKVRRKTGTGGPPAAPSAGSQVWGAYRDAYLQRYRVEPVRNARVNAQCAQLVGRLGQEKAEAVVRFYLGHNGSFYVRSSHALGPCLADAEGLATQAATGLKVTAASAQQADRTQSNVDVFRKVFTDMDSEGRLEKWK